MNICQSLTAILKAVGVKIDFDNKNIKYVISVRW